MQERRLDIWNPVISSAGCVFYWADPCPAVGARQAMRHPDRVSPE
jgi:hypothetical protein